MYILAQGQCEVLVKDQFKKDKFVKDIQPGTLFGEVGLIYNTKRTASIRSKDQCTVGAISEEVFQDMIKQYPEIEKSLINEARKYKDHWKRYQIQVLGNIDYLLDIPYSLKEDIHYRLVLENYEKGAKVFNRGTECQCIYFIVGGEMELIVEQHDTNKEHLLDILY